MEIPAILAGLADTGGTVLAFIVALSIIVAVHEYGHYIVGRWSGIHAEVFSIGFGPVLWSRVDRRGTRWQVAALPFGGYVKFLGDANAASAGADEGTMARLSDEERRHTMHGAPLWARAATVFAGPLFNFILSIIVFGALLFASGVATDTPEVASVKPLPYQHDLRPGDRILAVAGQETPDYSALGDVAETLPPEETVDYRVMRDGREISIAGPTLMPPLILGIQPRSAAQDAGLEIGDVILAMNGEPTPRFSDLQEVVREGKGAPVTLTVWRDGETFETTLSPRERPVEAADGGLETGYLIGISSTFVFEPATRSPGLGEAATVGVAQTWGIIRGTFTGISSMVAGRISTCNINGPVGIAQATGQAAEEGLTPFIWLVAALSTAIGLLNLFPIPVLDGGHLVFHAYEWAFGKPPPDRVMNTAMAVGLALVLSLMVFGLTNDLFCP
ncbi:Regulator of sigma-E protease RseP [Defluviimonas aquaemixtae]|uniref:Zinc metalloprotease n=1 Tax=Albidovulum aquaemixtae TaxID=1542388 RepID=A0A2R8B5Q6_9RHOB|nr:RIP metalloprotease RseP [Defluviimonas aquaemixtae]SPH17978.1 Regulator of sigma-E protease RseP [Defluviimonas aquaemixtae]